MRCVLRERGQEHLVLDETDDVLIEIGATLTVEWTDGRGASEPSCLSLLVAGAKHHVRWTLVL